MPVTALRLIAFAGIALGVLCALAGAALLYLSDADDRSGAWGLLTAAAVLGLAGAAATAALLRRTRPPS